MATTTYTDYFSVLNRECSSADPKTDHGGQAVGYRGTHPAAPGDVFVVRETSGHPLEWAVVEGDPVDDRRLLVVPVDTYPQVGSRDLGLRSRYPQTDRQPPLRSQHLGRRGDLDPGLRTGTLTDEELDGVRAKREHIESGTLVASIGEEHGSADRRRGDHGRAPPRDPVPGVRRPGRRVPGPRPRVVARHAGGSRTRRAELLFAKVENLRREKEGVLPAGHRALRGDPAPEMHFFSVVHDGDPATEISEKRLIRPLRRHISRERESWDIELTANGTKEDLAGILGGDETPALLFTAAHGLGYRSGHPRQAHNQGAILCQDWPGRGRGPLEPDHYFAAADLGADARLRGLIAFLFGCYSAGTPQLDNFPPAPLRNPIVRAPRSFISPLARRLLSHPNGSALAVLGHVDRTWTRSFGTGRGMGYLHIVSLLKRLLDGYPVGAAMDWMNERFAEISTELTDVLDAQEQALRYRHRTGAGSGPPDRTQLAGLWRANNDARNFVVLGDPAVRLADGPRAALVGEEARVVGNGADGLRAPGTPCPTCGRT